MLRKIQVLEILINEIVDRTYTVHADFHQGDQLMFRSNAGKQCVACHVTMFYCL